VSSRLGSLAYTRYLFAAQFRRLAAKRGKKRAIIAAAHSLLAVIYTLLKQGKGYLKLGAGYFDRLHVDDFKRYLVRNLQAQGYKVTLEAVA
jgi:transposase